MSELQTSMFDPKATVESKVLVRTEDPQTSRQAAESVDVAECERIFLSALREIGTAATAYDIANHQQQWPNKDTIRKRAGGLKRKQLIQAIDRNGLVPQTGRACERFLLTAKGLASIEDWSES
jgi:hypothetical protein